MLSTDMLARVRTLIDEASASYWQDSEIYSALSDGQTEAVNFIYGLYEAKKKADPNTILPDVLSPLTKSLSNSIVSSYTITIPTDLFKLIAIEITNGTNPKVAAYRRDFSVETIFYQYNSLMNGTNNVSYFSNAANYFFNQLLNGSYNIYYIENPPAISSGVNPTVGSAIHDIICLYAFSQVLKKDQRLEESTQNFNQFLSLLAKYMAI